MSKNKKAITILWLIALLVIPIVSWILPGDYFDDGKLMSCLSRSLFDIECIACDMLRALQYAHNFQWEDAVYYNTGVLVIYPLLFLFWGFWIYKAVQKLRRFSVSTNK